MNMYPAPEKETLQMGAAGERDKQMGKKEPKNHLNVCLMT